MERARHDYGVVILEIDGELAEYELDLDGTQQAREEIKRNRLAWLSEDPESVAERYRSREIDVFDVIRAYGVILDWGTGELLPRTTEGFRAMLHRRMVPHWHPV